MQHAIEKIKNTIRTIPDYPKPGIMFRDVTTVMQDGEAFNLTMNVFEEQFKDHKIDKVVGTEARGFIFGAALATRLGVGFIPVRKPGKLPREVYSETYELEYGQDVLEIHIDALLPNENVLVVDDLIATGGTIVATINLVEKLGAKVNAAAFVVNLPDIGGENVLKERGVDFYAICEFEGD